MSTNIHDKLFQFVVDCQRIVDSRPEPVKLVLKAKVGGTYAKIVAETHNSAPAWAFVALKPSQTKGMGTVKAGDIFKPASFSKPAKGARGNIFDPNPTANVGPYGPAYKADMK